jgi:RNA polymerase sigma-32 factor
MTTGSSVLTLSAEQHYFSVLQQHEMLDQEEEQELARRYRRKKDQTALRRLINGNLRLVVKIAKEFWSRSSVSLLDLIQEGNVGLIRAAKRFDPTRRVKFSYYAAFWIKAYIHKYLMDNYRTVRIGTTQNQRKLFFNLNKTRKRLARKGIEPTPAAIANKLNVPSTDVVEMQKRIDQPDLSLNAPLYTHEGETGEQVNRLRSPEPSAAQRFEKRQLLGLLRTYIRRFKRERLDDREKAILECRLLASQPDTLQVLGDRFGVSRERIRQVERRIIEKLRNYLFDNMPDIRWLATS